MLPWTRPEPHPEFEADAAALLEAVRGEIKAGKSPSETLEHRTIWSGSWKRRQQRPGIHKAKLAEPDGWFPKCAWCERKRDLNRELDVEHYRPKAKVTEWSGNPPIDIKTPPPEVDCGTGYWWLAFRWDNLSLACKNCNQHWKRNLFPVRPPRPDCTEGCETNEQPLLLDPASKFHTRDHFAWDIYSGRVQGVSDEGTATIITCGLNREELLQLRGKVSRSTFRAVQILIRAWRKRDHDNQRQAHERIAELTSDAAEFTSMTRWIVERQLDIPWEKLGF